jgi:hypothetical protein
MVEVLLEQLRLTGLVPMIHFNINRYVQINAETVEPSLQCLLHTEMMEIQIMGTDVAVLAQ